jgi:N-acetylmuramoyl-L-alanine amidase
LYYVQLHYFFNIKIERNLQIKQEYVTEKGDYYMIKKQKYLLSAVGLILLALIVYYVLSPPHTNEYVKQLVVLVEDNVNIRTEPSEASSIISKGNKGDTFPLIQQQKGWYQIVLPTKELAYVVSTLGTTTYEKNNKTLEGKTIVLDAGHGGKDEGAVGKRGTIEKEITLQTVKELQQKLEKLGAMVLLTREDDTYIELEDRVAISERKWADCFISIHYDSALTNTAKGITTFYYKEDKDKPLAKAIHESLITYTKANDRGYVDADYLVLRTNPIPSILLELGFLSNEEDEKRINTETFQQTAIHAIVEGIIAYVHS